MSANRERGFSNPSIDQMFPEGKRNMSHEHYPGCGHVRHSILSDAWDKLHGTTPQTKDESDENKRINETRKESDSSDGRGGGEAF